MDLKLTGRVVDILEEQSGTGRNGPWRKQEFILETEEEYPKQVCITQWGDDIEKFGVEKDDRLTVHVDLRSREYKGRWYTDVKAWRVEKEGGEDPAADLAEELPDFGVSEGEAAEHDLPF